MEPSSVITPISVDGRVKAADERIALLSSLLQKLEEAAQNDGLADSSPDDHQTQLVRVRLGMASSLFTALRAKHAATANHCFRVAVGVSSWSAARNLPEDHRDAIEVAALLHDVGKIGVPDSVLAKPGKLSAEEQLAIERSRLVGYEVLSGCCAATLVHEIMLYAGAWYDGSKHGYDRSGDKLPLGSRMLAIVDAFDSMTTEHVYRPALSRERALGELCEWAGTQFDPTLASEFCELVTRDAGPFHKHVARRWLQDLSPEKSDVHWTLRQTILTNDVRPDSEFQMRLVDSMSDGVIFIDKESRILRWNAAAERLTGLAADTVLDKHWSPTLVRLRDEGGRLVTDQECPTGLALRTSAQTLRRYSLVNRTNDRTPVDLEILPVLGEQGVPRGLVLVMHDVSSQASLEESVHSLHERASRDPLTKAANRAEFNRVFPEFIDTHLKAGRPCSLVICDIDHFKKINDSYGHQAGDEALVLFTSILLRHARAGDLVVRYGGEEFVVLCADCDNGAATRRADEIRRRVAETQMTSLNNHCITASFGVTEIQGGDTPETFLNRADRALLQAKDGGRNMVVQLGTGIRSAEKSSWSQGWRSLFGGQAAEVLLDRTLLTMVPLKVTAEKLRGFVADHQAQLVKVDDDRVTLTIDSQFIPLLRRTTDRAVPFQIELTFYEKQLPVEGRQAQTALRTLIHVSIRPKRQRDRRLRDSIERARQLLASLKSYLMAQDYLMPDAPESLPASREGILRSSQRLLSHWLRK
jgi:diguanylate cyclase (GGDEF)-like protein/PAS domain S-box-containing protein